MDEEQLRQAMREMGRKGALARWDKATEADKIAAATHASRARWKGHKPKNKRRKPKEKV